MKFTTRYHFLVAVLIGASAASSPALARPFPQSGGKTDTPPETVHVGGDIKPPLKVKNVPPVYPQIAITSRTQGVVILEATIGTDGKVKDTKLLRSIKQLDDAAIAAVRAWEYKPTLVNGKPVQVIMTIPVNFTLN
jgi:protein TonB